MISVIVPIYKVEPYLKRCLDSLLAQTYTKFELILVEDGSPDRCGEICEDYARRDPRIRVIHKRNGGLSDARNAGLAAAAGEYIAFVDSDDWVSPDYLRVLLEVLETSGSEICECEVRRTAGEEDTEYGASPEKTETYETEEALKELIYDRVFHQQVWNKLYKKRCLENVLFPVGKTNEDEFWTYRVFGNADRIAKTNQVLYYYFQRGGSIMGETYNMRRLDALEAKQERQEYIAFFHPTLAATAKINLFTSCIYSGQMTLKYLKGAQRRKAMVVIDKIQEKSRPEKSELAAVSVEGKGWILLARVNFWLLCRLKNLLRKGF